jgi:hypothetical protein
VVVGTHSDPADSERRRGREVRERTRQLEAQNEARKRESLRQAQKMEAVGQLTGGIAHDFDNLLTIVLGGLEIIGRQMPALEPSVAASRIQRARDMALDGARRAVTLTSRVLAFSRQQPLAPKAVDADPSSAPTADSRWASEGKSGFAWGCLRFRRSSGLQRSERRASLIIVATTIATPTLRIWSQAGSALRSSSTGP